MLIVDTSPLMTTSASEEERCETAIVGCIATIRQSSARIAHPTIIATENHIAHQKARNPSKQKVYFLFLG